MKILALLWEYFLVYMFGGLAYAVLETMLRGATHWTMFLTGGLCFLSIYCISVYSGESLVKKGIMGAFIITTIEFLVGIAVNVLLRWDVWDYSRYAFNLMGQICLGFSSLWFFISIGGVVLSGFIRKLFLRLTA